MAQSLKESVKLTIWYNQKLLLIHAYEFGQLNKNLVHLINMFSEKETIRLIKQFCWMSKIFFGVYKLKF